MAGLPFKRVPKTLIRGGARKVEQMHNRFAKKEGISECISLAEIVDGSPKIDANMKTIAFGQFAEVHDGTDNTKKPRTVPAIAMFQNNDRGGFAFMSLETGRCINSYVFT